MNRTTSLRALAAAAVLAASATQAAPVVSTFDDLPLSPDSAYLPQITTTFTSGAGSFHHEFTDFGFGCCWQGWTYSNRADTATPGFTNDTSAITGGGVNGSANYGIGFLGEARVSFAAPTLLSGAYFTNTTYAYLAMRDGDDGNDPAFVKGPFEAGDFFTLTVQGRDAGDVVVGTIDITLADGTDILDQWKWVDLRTLGAVSALTFVLDSSDVAHTPFGDFVNTPTYFAIDDLTAVPLPAAGWLLVSSLGALAARRRRG